MRWILLALAVTACDITLGTKGETGVDTGSEADADTDTDADADADTDADADSDGDIAGCSGSHSGNYEGDAEGLVEGDLEADGTFYLTFINFIDIDIVGTVHPTGDVDGSGFGYQVDGTYDFGACTMSGTWWEVGGDDEGTWSGARD